MECCSNTSGQTPASGCRKFSANLLVASVIGVRYFFLDWHPIRLSVAAVVVSIPLWLCDLQYSAFIGMGGCLIGKAIRDILPLVNAAKAAPLVNAAKTTTSVAIYLNPMTKGGIGVVFFAYGMQAAYKQAFID